jgi:hypothetical protein
VTIRIETKRDITAIQEVRAQNLQLIGGEGVNEIGGGRAERVRRQKSVRRPRSN